MDECTKKLKACGSFVIENQFSGQFGKLKAPYTARRVTRKGVMLFYKNNQ